MDRSSIRAAALAATMSLAITCTDARADPEDPTPVKGTHGAEQAVASAAIAAGKTTTAAGRTTTADAGSISGDRMKGPPQQADSSGASAPADVVDAAQDVVAAQAVQPSPNAPQPSPSDSQPTSATSPPAGPEPATLPTSPSEAAEPGEVAEPRAQAESSPPAPVDKSPRTIDESPAADPEPPAEETFASTELPQARASSADGTPSSAVATSDSPGAPLGPMGDVPTARGSPQEAPALERVLADAGLGLRAVEGQIDALERRLDTGAPPRKSDLLRLLASLEQIAPVLLALEARLDAAGPLKPRLQALLHRLRTRLDHVRASASDLLAALSRFGVPAGQLGLLLHELEHFGMLAGAPSWTRGGVPITAPWELGPKRTYTWAPPPASTPPHVAGGSSERRADSPRGEARQHDGGALSASAPRSSALGSATAAPGGASVAAGLASLAVLLAALALPGLSVRFELPPGRRYTAAFPAALERPG